MEASVPHCAIEYTNVPLNAQRTLARREIDRFAVRIEKSLKTVSKERFSEVHKGQLAAETLSRLFRPLSRLVCKDDLCAPGYNKYRAREATMNLIGVLVEDMQASLFGQWVVLFQPPMPLHLRYCGIPSHSQKLAAVFAETNKLCGFRASRYVHVQ